MKPLIPAVVWLWWLAVAYVPVAQVQFIRRYSAAIGCPPTSECYVPGSEHLLYLELLAFGSAFLLWPACLWFVVIRPVARRLGKMRRVS